MNHQENLGDSDFSSYRKNGFLIIDPILSQESATYIEMEILGLLPIAEKKRMDEGKEATANRFMVGLHLQSEVIYRYAKSDKNLAIANELLSGESEIYFTSTITKAPDKNMPLDWHQDHAYDNEKRLDRVIFWTSITDSNPENGGLSVVPFSHKLGPVPHIRSTIYGKDLRATNFEPKLATPVSLTRGQIIALHPLLIHGSGANETESSRVALMVGYQRKSPLI